MRIFPPEFSNIKSIFKTFYCFFIRMDIGVHAFFKNSIVIKQNLFLNKSLLLE